MCVCRVFTPYTNVPRPKIIMRCSTFFLSTSCFSATNGYTAPRGPSCAEGHVAASVNEKRTHGVVRLSARRGATHSLAAPPRKLWAHFPPQRIWAAWPTSSPLSWTRPRCPPACAACPRSKRSPAAAAPATCAAAGRGGQNALALSGRVRVCVCVRGDRSSTGRRNTPSGPESPVMVASSPIVAKRAPASKEPRAPRALEPVRLPAPAPRACACSGGTGCPTSGFVTWAARWGLGGERFG